jgi:hypothetical protein
LINSLPDVNQYSISLLRFSFSWIERLVDGEITELGDSDNKSLKKED